MNVGFRYGTKYWWAHGNSFFWSEQLVVVLVVVLFKNGLKESQYLFYCCVSVVFA
jgi:hypothetical protein